MKEKIIPLFLICFIASLTSCKSPEKFDIKMKLVENDHFQQNIETTTRVVTSIDGEPVDLMIKSDIAGFFDVVGSTALEQELKMTFSRTRFNIRDMNGNMDTSLNTSNEFAGRSIGIFLAAEGNLKRIKGIEGLNPKKDTKQKLQTFLQNIFSQEHLTGLYKLALEAYPGKSLSIGESWVQNNKVNFHGFGLIFKTTYTLRSVRSGEADIETDGIAGATATINDVSIHVSGTQNGLITFSRRNGHIKKGQCQTNLSMKLFEKEELTPATFYEDYRITGN